MLNVFKNPSVYKWLAGILASVVAALLVGWLTKVGPFRLPPNIQILRFEVKEPVIFQHEINVETTDRVLAGKPVEALVTLYNDGGSTAVECDVIWFSDDIPMKYQSSLKRFSVPSKQTVEVTLTARFAEPSTEWRRLAGGVPFQSVFTALNVDCYQTGRKAEMLSPKGHLETKATRYIDVYESTYRSR